MENKIQLFEDRRIRYVWDAEREEWLFSVVDVVGVLTDQPDLAHARNYWKVLKNRLKDEGNETVTNCNQLKMLAADGKQRLTDVADIEQVLRIIQSIPSPKAEPFKMWSGMSVQEYKQVKGLKKENIRDNMTNIELVLNMLAEVATTVISKSRKPETFSESKAIAKEGGDVAKDARLKAPGGERDGVVKDKEICFSRAKRAFLHVIPCPNGVQIYKIKESYIAVTL